MKNQFRPLLALLIILPLAIFLTLQTLAPPRGEADEGIERRRREQVEDEKEKDERIHRYRKAEAELKELVDVGRVSPREAKERLEGLKRKLWADEKDGEEEHERRRYDRDDDDEEEEHERRRYDRDDDDEEEEHERRRHDRDDEEEERDIHLRAAMEHLQGAGFSARTARQVIGEIIRREREDDGHHDDRHDAERRRHAEEHERDHHDRDEHDRDHRDRAEHDHHGHDEEELHARSHHQMANQLEALRREVSELHQLVERLSRRR